MVIKYCQNYDEKRGGGGVNYDEIVLKCCQNGAEILAKLNDFLKPSRSAAI
jgi:hypothetical protein